MGRVVSPLIHGVLWEADGDDLEVIGVRVASAGQAVADPRTVRAAVAQKVVARHVEAVRLRGVHQLPVDGQRGAADLGAGVIDQADQRLDVSIVGGIHTVADLRSDRRAGDICGPSCSHDDLHPEDGLRPDQNGMPLRITQLEITAVGSVR